MTNGRLTPKNSTLLSTNASESKLHTEESLAQMEGKKRSNIDMIFDNCRVLGR